jgi:hypothetical protein
MSLLARLSRIFVLVSAKSYETFGAANKQDG